MVVIARHIISPPLWERYGRPSSSKHRETQDEKTRETCPIEGASNEIRVVLEDTRAVVAQVELGVESNDGPAEQHACLRLVIRYIARVLYELRKVDLIDRELADLWNKLEMC